MSEPGKAVFLSYASQDAEAARRICEALRTAGIEVWFDQNELRGGDTWDQKIRRQIKECALFVPLISTNTQARPEGYFRLEWKLAVDRSHLMADDAPFLFPIVIGDVTDATARVPERFREVQWTRLRLDETPGELASRVARLLAGGPKTEDGRPVAAGRLASAVAPGRKGLPVWFWVVVVLIAGFVALEIFKPRRSSEEIAKLVQEAQAIAAQVAKTEPPANPPASQPSAARQLADRAREILKQGSLTRAQLDAAGQLCDRALQLDATDPIVWAVAANADLLYIYPYGYDLSEERRRRAQERAARATSLGPELFEVRVIQAAVFAHAVGTPALLAEAEKTFRELIATHPGDKDLVTQLAEILREQKRFDEAAKLFETVGESEVAGWSYFQAGELRRALAAAGRSPRSVTGLQLKAILQLAADENLDEAQATVDQLQPSELLAQMPAATAMQIAFYRRDPARMLEIAQGLSDDYLDSNAFHGPRGYYTGLADELAGRPGPAQSEWHAALGVVQARLQAAPDNRELLLWSAWLHAALNATAEAERLFARSQALAGLGGDTMDEANVPVLLRLRRTEALLAGARRIFQTKTPGWEQAHAEMRFSPECDFLRGDPRFEKLLRDNLPPGARRFDDPKPATRPPAPEVPK